MNYLVSLPQNYQKRINYEEDSNHDPDAHLQHDGRNGTEAGRNQI
jgi:hypothetical protein